jgi:hypothetical protein
MSVKSRLRGFSGLFEENARVRRLSRYLFETICKTSGCPSFEPSASDKPDRARWLSPL